MEFCGKRSFLHLINSLVKSKYTVVNSIANMFGIRMVVDAYHQHYTILLTGKLDVIFENRTCEIANIW